MLGWLLGNPVVAADNPPFTFAAPTFFGKPAISHNLLGTNYVYVARARAAHTLLMISTMAQTTIRSQLGQLSEAQCVSLFQREIGNTHARFFAVSDPAPLAVGAGRFPQVRWTAHKDHHMETGVLACGELDGRYYVVHFADELKSAITSFPFIRAALHALRSAPEQPQ